MGSFGGFRTLCYRELIFWRREGPFRNERGLSVAGPLCWVGPLISCSPYKDHEIMCARLDENQSELSLNTVDLRLCKMESIR